MNEVQNDYIEKALNELIPTLGVREFINHERLVALVGSNKIKEAIKGIALDLGLPIEVNVSYLPKGYRPSSNDGFRSTHLVKTDQHNRGVGGITAQVSIPSNLPFYGSPSMVNFPINVRLSENYAENPATLISIIAHELSHIVLYSLWNKEKENEFYTDLTAMTLGFANIMKTGRKIIKVTQLPNATHTSTTTYGYLSDDNFSFAFKKINNILNKQKSEKKKLLRKLRGLKKQLNKTSRLSFYFNKYLGHLDKNLNQKISQEDGKSIMAFHQPGHTDNFIFAVRKNENTLERFLKYMETLKNYTDKNIEDIKQHEMQLKLDNKELGKQQFLLKKDIDLLRKYASLFFRIKMMVYNLR